MNQSMSDMREQVFKEYRDALASHMDIDSRCSQVQTQLQELHRDRSKSYETVQRLRSLIEIMIKEDCDPTMAKLKFEENIASEIDMTAQAGISQIGTYEIKHQYNIKAMQANRNGLLKRIIGAFNG